jgi:mannose-6-phosphate isomerase-like protein (cupin superfamily)
MKIIKSKEFKAKNAWDSIQIANMQGITTKLHWTNQAYKWHVNDGQEVFVVLDGKVEMFYKQDDKEQSCILESGDIFYANLNCEHYASPIGEARILVIESENSI